MFETPGTRLKQGLVGAGRMLNSQRRLLADGFEAAITTTSNTQMTVGAGTFVHNVKDAGKFFPVGSIVYGTATPNAAVHWVGTVLDYTATSLTVFIASNNYTGAGKTYNSWALLNLGPAPLVPAIPGGRLTLSSGAAVMSGSVSGATTVYYTNYNSQHVPIWNGSGWVQTNYGGQLSQATTDATKSPAAVAPCQLYNVFVWMDGTTPRLSRGAAITQVTATVTMTIASPCVVSWAGNTLKPGDPVVFTTTGALPTGITAGTVYWLISAGFTAGTSFRISATAPGTGGDGTVVNTSGSQSGTHTGAQGWSGDPSGELTRTVGVVYNINAIANGPAANYGTYVGTVASNASSQIDFIFGALAQRGTAAFLGVWNAYNRVPISTFVQDNTNTWTYTTNAWRSANAGPTMSVRQVFGLQEDSIFAEYNSASSSSNTATVNRDAGLGYDSNTAIASGSTTGRAFIAGMTNGAAATENPITAMRATLAVQPTAGLHTVTGIERSAATGTSTWYGDNNDPTNLQTGLVYQTRY